MFRAQAVCEGPGGHPGLPVPNSPYGLCGREATLKRTLVDRMVSFTVTIHDPKETMKYFSS